MIVNEAEEISKILYQKHEDYEKDQDNINTWLDSFLNSQQFKNCLMLIDKQRQMHFLKAGKYDSLDRSSSKTKVKIIENKCFIHV